MLPHVHPPHHGIIGWRDFFVSVAIVVVGLLIAVGLEQSVEYIHHSHQRAQIEEQMREVLETNSQIISDDLQILNGFRTYLADLQAATAARRQGNSTPGPPAASDPRNYTYAPPPNLGAYDAAKANGAVALLGLDQIRIYDRIAYQHSLVLVDLERYRDATIALRAFGKRFDSTEVSVGLTSPVNPADLAALSPTELLEYQALIGTALETLDQYNIRLRRLDAMSRALLNGAHTEKELMDAVTNAQGASANVPKARHE